MHFKCEVSSSKGLKKPSVDVSSTVFLTDGTAHVFPSPLGSLKSYDAAADVAVVDYKGDQLTIDACLLTDFQFRIDSLYEFIGEVQASE